MPPLRWGVLGAAWVARQAMLPALRAAGAPVVAIAARDPERARACAQAFGIPTVHPSYEAVCADPAVEAVYIPLPTHLHRPWALRAAAHGKPVLCEKPLAESAAAAEEMRQAFAVRGLLLGEAVMYRYHPRWPALRALVDGGELGALRHLSAAFTFPLDPAPNYRWEAACGGGALLDVGSYGVNAVCWLAGGAPEAVAACSVARGGVDLETTAVLRFPGGPTATVVAGFGSAEHQVLTVIGTRGTLTVPRPFTAWTAESYPATLVRDGAAEPIPMVAADPYAAMVQAFTRAVRAGQPFATTAAEGCRTLHVLDACRRAAGHQRWERVSLRP